MWVFRVMRCVLPMGPSPRTPGTISTFRADSGFEIELKVKSASAQKGRWVEAWIVLKHEVAQRPRLGVWPIDMGAGHNNAIQNGPDFVIV